LPTRQKNLLAAVLQNIGAAIPSTGKDNQSS